MYLDYFQLNAKPFEITVDPKFLWLGDKHKEALATLRYGILDNRGFLLLTGEVGTGKTILINQLITTLDIGTVVATIPDPDLVSMDFYNLLADGFKMNRTFNSKSAFLIHLRDFLHKSNADRKQVLLIIDESQRLNHQLMEDIRVLSNIELHDKKLINVFFVGQQEFNNILMTPQNRALAQRITVRYHIEPLNKEETGQYILHRLKLAGSKKEVFKRSAIPEIFAFSGGIPRLINIICDRALLTCFAKGKKEVDDAMVQECAVELRIPVKNPTAEPADLDQKSPHKKVEKKSPIKNPIVDKTAKGQHSPSSKPQDAAIGQRASAWRAVVLFALLILIGLVAFALIQLDQSKGPRYGTEDLTPKKYFTTLEQEKEKLANRLENGEASSLDNSDTAKPDEVKSLDTQGKPNQHVATSQNETNNNDKNSDKASSSFLEAEIEPLPFMKERIIIQFSLNSNEIELKSFPVLDRIAAYLKKHPDEMINIRGYTDSTGSPGYNESVSRFRAGTVKSYLLGKGAPEKNMRIFAMGAADPVASNDTADGRSLNRRVEIDFPPAEHAEQ